MSGKRFTVVAVTAAISLALLGACTSVQTGKARSDSGEGASVLTSSPASGAGTVLSIAEIDELGPVVTDAKGLTLYRFDKDTSNPPVSNCDADCEVAWPPAIVTSDEMSVSGVDRSLVGTLVRKDGSKQLTIDGWPVYGFARDVKPGDTTGHAVQGTWWAVTPEGKRAGQARGPAVVTGVVNGLGTVLTDAKGLTLYRFDKDTTTPPKSNCDGDCEVAWPPIIVTSDKTEVKDIDPSIVGTLTRADGSKQLTVGGWAVYRFAKDTKPGEAKGQAAQGAWFVIAPSGRKALENKDLEVTTATGGGGIGAIATEKTGMTLYRFDKDSATPSTTTCTGECAVQWPPVLVSGDNRQAQGVDSSLVGAITRPDGTKQLTIAGMPQYTFAGDKLCGEVNGQGVDGVWWATTPTGGKAGQ